jgi:hypothetical protein
MISILLVLALIKTSWASIIPATLPGCAVRDPSKQLLSHSINNSIANMFGLGQQQNFIMCRK